MAGSNKPRETCKQIRPLARSGAVSAAAHPVFLLAGGGNTVPLLRPIIARVKRKAPAVAYIGAASGDDAAFFRSIASAFKQAGAGEVRLAATVSSRVDPRAALAVLHAADIIFISGGDVEAGMHHLEQRAMVPELRRLHRAGKIFVGLSAGSIMLAKSWVVWSDPRDDDSAGVLPCLGIAPVLCDVHAEADDWEELQVLLRLVKRTVVGYGIPQGGGLQVSPGGTVKTLGPAVTRFVLKRGEISRLSSLQRPAKK